MLHTFSENVLRNGEFPALGTSHTVDGHTITFTEEMLETCTAYVEYVRSLKWTTGFSVENRVRYSKVLGVPHAYAFGTADVVGVTHHEDGYCIEVIDLKTGRSPVSPERNPQMVLYAVGFMDSVTEDMGIANDTAVRLTIYQPRLSRRPFTWQTTVGEVMRIARDLRQPAQAAVRFHDGSATPKDLEQFPEMTGSHCRYCDRKPVCTTFNKKVKSIQVGATVVWDAELFGLRKVITSYLEDLEQLALDSALSGRQLQGTKLVTGRAGRPVVVMPESELLALTEQYGVKAALTETKMVWATPAKVRDTLKKAGLPADKLAAVVVSPEAKPVIADADDPRAEYSGVKDGDTFTGVAAPL
jgi:hypothetical protein